MKRSIYLIFLLFALTMQTFAQTTPVEMADELRGSGKIYVVVAVIAIILLALLLYLFSIDRRLKKIENRR